MLKNEYSSGKGDFEEVLQMERQQLDYILTLEKAKRDQRTAVANIQYLKGE